PLGGVDQGQQHLQQPITRFSRTRWDDLDVGHALKLQGKEPRALKNTADGLVCFQHPVADHGGSEHDDGRALDPDHGVNPFAYARVLFEKARVHQIHAASPRHLAVDDSNLAVKTQVCAADEATKKTHG